LPFGIGFAGADIENRIGTMAKKRKLPDPLHKRDLLYSRKGKAVNHVHYGDLFLEEGMVNDALDFYAASGNPQKIRIVLDRALQAGDAFLLRRVEKVLPREVTAETWERLGDNAAAQEKYHYALQAYERAKSEEKTKAAREHLMEFLAKTPWTRKAMAKPEEEPPEALPES
jgi:hypothetical protein